MSDNYKQNNGSQKTQKNFDGMYIVDDEKIMKILKCSPAELEKILISKSKEIK